MTKMFSFVMSDITLKQVGKIVAAGIVSNEMKKNGVSKMKGIYRNEALMATVYVGVVNPTPSDMLEELWKTRN